MRKIKFKPVQEQDGLYFYSCSEDGNQYGEYVRVEDINELVEDAKNGSDWSNSYQKIEDFLLHHLGDRIVTHHEEPHKNTIDSICRLAGLID